MPIPFIPAARLARRSVESRGLRRRRPGSCGAFLCIALSLATQPVAAQERPQAVFPSPRSPQGDSLPLFPRSPQGRSFTEAHLRDTEQALRTPSRTPSRTPPLPGTSSQELSRRRSWMIGLTLGALVGTDLMHALRDASPTTRSRSRLALGVPLSAVILWPRREPRAPEPSGR